MAELLTAAQMRAIEQAAIESGEVTGLELMERAGRGVVEAILEWRPELATTSHRAVVLCGPGNNGGDGFVVARLLKQRGWEVEVFLYGNEAKLPPDAAKNARRWRELGEISLLPKQLDPTRQIDLVVDALFGIGFNKPIDPGVLQDFWDTISNGWWQLDLKRKHIVSIDFPSGICTESGRPIHKGVVDYRGGANDDRHLQIYAGLTVTFQRPKIGHYLAVGVEHCGSLKTVDLEIPQTFDKYRREQLLKYQIDGSVFLSYRPDFEKGDSHQADRRWRHTRPFSRGRAYLDKTEANGGAHKFSHGHALILSGGPGKGGAARLAARGALRIGAGLATVGCPPPALTENAARLDAVMLAPVDDVQALAAEIEARKVNAICIGPGFGLGERLRAFVEAMLKVGVEPHPTLVLDADALTEFQNDPATLFDMLHHRCVLTPHEGEFGRLFPDILAKLKEPATKGPAYSKVDATREAARRAGCVVLFKGPDTVVAEPSGRCAINSAQYERAAPWLATAGSGDVLAGFITGLLARGFDPMQAAETAAWLHVECALKFGPGLIAEDLPEQLPAVFRDLGL
ncbi:MAG: NAD(P)H-hydrate dehydratase [Pseudomonadota bacterium]